jgi:hypothetical protein
MSEPLARLYDLALRALDVQERRADALRGRLGPVLAAAALGVTLLSGPVVGGAHPHTLAGKLALAVAVGSLLVVVITACRVLAERRQPIDRLNPHALLIEFRASGLLDDETAFHGTMVARLTGHLGQSIRAVERLAAMFTTMVCGILVMLCGLALAALVG